MPGDGVPLRGRNDAGRGADSENTADELLKKALGNVPKNRDKPAENEFGDSSPASEFTDTLLSDEEIFTVLTAEIEAGKIILAEMAAKGDFNGAGILSETIAGLQGQHKSLFDALSSQHITPEDIHFMREKIPGYTSVLNLTEPQKAACVKLIKLFDELGTISPFMRRENDVLEDDQTQVPILELEDVFGGNEDLRAAINSIKREIKTAHSGGETNLPFGVHRNEHTNWEIETVRRSFEESFTVIFIKF